MTSHMRLRKMSFQQPDRHALAAMLLDGTSCNRRHSRPALGLSWIHWWAPQGSSKLATGELSLGRYLGRRVGARRRVGAQGMCTLLQPHGRGVCSEQAAARPVVVVHLGPVAAAGATGVGARAGLGPAWAVCQLLLGCCQLHLQLSHLPAEGSEQAPHKPPDAAT